jgi:geranylgeranyl diphosphate synthase type I
MDIDGLRANIEARLGDVFAPSRPFEPTFREMVSTLYGAQKVRRAKRLRPILVMLGAQLAGGAEADVIDLALALEIIHDFSAILDDMMDNDRLRRGEPTTWTRFGPAASMTMAAGLYTVAVQHTFHWVAEPGAGHCRTAAAGRMFKAAMELHDAQLADLASERSATCSLEQCLHMARGRSVLIGVAPALGAAAAGATAATVTALERISAPLATAYSLNDDAKSFAAGNMVTGKTPNGDIRQRKKTYPIVAAFDALAPSDKAFVGDIWRGSGALTEFEVAKIRELLDATEAVARTFALVDTLVRDVESRLAAIATPQNATARAVIHAFLDSHFRSPQNAVPACR